jgi:hypothetical protein
MDLRNTSAIQEKMKISLQAEHYSINRFSSKEYVIRVIIYKNNI